MLNRTSMCEQVFPIHNTLSQFNTSETLYRNIHYNYFSIRTSIDSLLTLISVSLENPSCPEESHSSCCTLFHWHSTAETCLIVDTSYTAIQLQEELLNRRSVVTGNHMDFSLRSLGQQKLNIASIKENCWGFIWQLSIFDNQWTVETFMCIQIINH